MARTSRVLGYCARPFGGFTPGEEVLEDDPRVAALAYGKLEQMRDWHNIVDTRPAPRPAKPATPPMPRESERHLRVRNALEAAVEGPGSRASAPRDAMRAALEAGSLYVSVGGAGITLTPEAVTTYQVLRAELQRIEAEEAAK